MNFGSAFASHCGSGARIGPGLSCGLLAVVLGLAACDSTPGPPAPEGRPPVLSNLAYSPHCVRLTGTPPLECGEEFETTVADDVVEVPFTVSVDAVDPDGAVEEVIFTLRTPDVGDEPLVTAPMSLLADNRYEYAATLELPIGLVGNYTVFLYAVDAEGQVSNQARGQLELDDPGGPPRIDTLLIPDTITRPAPGEPDLLIPWVVVASDPEGVENLLSAVFWNVTRPDQVIALLDDGGVNSTSGDEVAGDGRYTITVRLNSDNQASVNRFAFQVTDRRGLQSEIVEKEVTIQ